MHLILTGATGLVGSAVLDALIRSQDVTRISILSRRPVPMAQQAADPRINVIIHGDFEKYGSDVLHQLQGAQGCVWALGISQTQVGPEDYVKITKSFPLAAAEAFKTIPPPATPFHFVYVSGEGATHTPGRFTPIFGRVKGEAETALSQLYAPGSFLTSVIRPAGVDASGHDAIKPFVPIQPLPIRMSTLALLPLLKAFYPAMLSPTESLGRFMVEMAMGRHDAEFARGAKGVESLGDMAVVRNVGYRRIMGL